MNDALVAEFLFALDLAGTFVFALSGALAGVRHKLDLFGVLGVAFVAATAGGIVRDLLIGAVPPPAVADWRYLVTTLAAGLLTFYFHSTVDRMHNSVLIFDAAGLALFAVAGALKAVASGLHPVSACLLGMLTGIGGGMARDLLVGEVPIVLRADLYAVAALVGAAVTVVGLELQLPSFVAAPIGALLCFGLRMTAIRRGWRLPTAPGT
ncbi:MAG TPA: trimeric intracellular cation channel family protein [Candidatus Eisenbacteria bacterium]|nr:trimeric intracellular cation channel family protein [Candidatus Eisenbacteria bacterium]